jgi:hypothetical protein
MKILYSVLLVPVFLISGCDSSSQDIFIDLDRKDSVSMKDFVDRIDVVQLESNTQCILRGVSSLILYEDNFYIFDEGGGAVLCFSKAGKFKYKIHSLGRGPEEYSYLAHFNIDPYNKRLILLNPWGEILYYDLDGKFIEKIILPSECRACNEVYAINRDTLLFVTLVGFSFQYYSWTENKIVKSVFPIEPETRKMFPMRRISRYKDSYFFNSLLDENKIYNLSLDDIAVDYVWNFGKLNYTKNQIEKIHDYIREQDLNRKVIRTTDFVGKDKILGYFMLANSETDRYRLALVMLGDTISKTVLLLYDKYKKEYFVFDKTTEGIQPYFIQDIQDESIVLWDYGSGYKYFDLDILNDEQRELINNHNKETDNPFLVVYHLKQ